MKRTEKGQIIQLRQVSDEDPLEFEVRVRDESSETSHRVTISRETCKRLTAGEYTAEQCLEAAFQFLLDREPKEAILRRFEVGVISAYFPEFESQLSHYLARS
jgi:hypothetical protein